MLRPRTGEILALANFPNFDPNHPGASRPTPCATASFPTPTSRGSTFKIVVVSGALDQHVVTLADTFDCENGHFTYAGAFCMTTSLTAFYGRENHHQVLQHRRGKIGIQLGEEELYHYIRNFGFGSRTGISLPFEVWGDVPPVKSWSKLSIARIPDGPGHCRDPLQMAMAMSAIANKGLLMRPMLVDRLADADGKVVVKYRRSPSARWPAPPAIAQMVTALKTVVSSEGTAPKARMEHYIVAGKTGTAEKVEHGHYVSDKYFSCSSASSRRTIRNCAWRCSLTNRQRRPFRRRGRRAIFKAIAERAANYLNLKPDLEPIVPPTKPSRWPPALPAGPRPVKNN